MAGSKSGSGVASGTDAAALLAAAEPKSAGEVASGTDAAALPAAAADPISWWFEAEGGEERGDAQDKLTADIGTELMNWCLPGHGRYLLLGEGQEEGSAKAHALRVYLLQKDETYDKREDLVTQYWDESVLIYSDHFSALVPQPTMEGVLKPTDEFTDEPMQDASMALSM